MNSYQPTHPHFQGVWRRLGPAARLARWRQARERERVLKRVAKQRPDESERAALRRLEPDVDRSNFRRWKQRFDKYGFDGLFDWRMPPPGSITTEVRIAICTLRQADPQISVERIIEHVATHQGVTTNATSVKEVLHQEGLARRRGPPAREQVGEQPMELGGMKLVEAALVDTGYLERLVEGVAQLTAIEGEGPLRPADTADRDEYGRFESPYNERLRKDPQDPIGPGFASIEQKRQGLDRSRLHVTGVRVATLERKLLALLVSPLLGSGRWDGIRVARGDLLGELCGYPYMPATLDLFTRELKYLGAASTLWEIHARQWMEVTGRWGGPRSAAVLYIDGSDKPVWTELFSQASKVSQLGRVMPALEMVCFHTGYGVPLWMVTHSGRAPLVKVVPKLLVQLDEIFGGTAVGRIVIMDAEGDSIPFLKGLEQGEPPRAFVTRLKPSLLAGKLVFNQTNFRPYRDGDRVRMGLCDFNDPAGGTFRMRVIEVQRRSKETSTFLAASVLLDERKWKPQDLADLYFDRWPNQEANFRAVNQAVGFKDVHGYGKQLVANVTVVSELDRLQLSTTKLENRSRALASELQDCQQLLHEEGKLLRREEGRLKTLDQKLKSRLRRGCTITPQTRRLLDEQQALARSIARRKAACARCEKKLEIGLRRLSRLRAQLAEQRDTETKLEGRRQIFKHDVELDSIFSLLKVGLTLLVTFVLKEYLGDARMDVVTFLERVATLPARLRLTPTLEMLTFIYNHRDPDVMALLATQSAAINARALRTRSGRILRIQVDPAPPPRLPPPPNRRVNPGDRFVKS